MVGGCGRRGVAVLDCGRAPQTSTEACCYESWFTGVHSLSCLGGTSCTWVFALRHTVFLFSLWLKHLKKSGFLKRSNSAGTQSRFEIQRNLFCSSTSKRTGNTKQGACVSGDDNYPLGFGFVFADSGDHCVTCEGEDTCQGANFWFEKPGSGISMTCDGKGFATACESSSTVIGLFGNSCLHLTCVETGDCDSLEIREMAGSGGGCRTKPNKTTNQLGWLTRGCKGRTSLHSHS